MERELKVGSLALGLVLVGLVFPGCREAPKPGQGEEATSSSESLLTRSFKIPNEFFWSDVAAGNRAEGLLKSLGVEFPRGAAATFVRAEKLLLVENTEFQLAVTQAVVDFWQRVGPAPDDTGNLVVESKLREIIIPMVRFDGIALSEALAFLEAESVKYDKTGLGERGVTIELEEGLDPTIQVKEKVDPDDFGFGAGGDIANVGNVGDVEIHISLANVPLAEALRNTVSLAQLRYTVADAKVIVLAHYNPPPDLETRIFEVPPRFETLLQSYSGNGTAVDPFLEKQDDVADWDLKEHFEYVGITFGSGAFVILDEDRSLLIVRNSPDQLELVEAFLASVLPQDPDEEWVKKRVARFEDKLDSIRFSSVSFENENCWRVFSELTEKSRFLDSKGALWERGVPIRLDLMSAPLDFAGADGFDGWEQISLKVSDASLREVLREIAKMKRLVLEIDGYGAVFRRHQ